MFIFTQGNLSAGSTMAHYYKTYKQIQESIMDVYKITEVERERRKIECHISSSSRATWAQEKQP